MLIDDFSNPELISALNTRWRAFTDRVMGGVSEGALTRDSVASRDCLHLTGKVRTENNGGFVQAALDLAPGGGDFDASAFSGLCLVVRGNGETYSLHLRTPDNRLPWQSYRAEFTAGPSWQTIELPFDGFAPYRLNAPLDLKRLRRIGLVAIGRAFEADLAVAEIYFYR